MRIQSRSSTSEPQPTTAATSFSVRTAARVAAGVLDATPRPGGHEQVGAPVHLVVGDLGAHSERGLGLVSREGVLDVDPPGAAPDPAIFHLGRQVRGVGVDRDVDDPDAGGRKIGEDPRGPSTEQVAHTVRRSRRRLCRDLGGGDAVVAGEAGEPDPRECSWWGRALGGGDPAARSPRRPDEPRVASSSASRARA